ncbi:MAG: response regulator transcription factor [Acidobacteriaceae bacterium]
MTRFPARSIRVYLRFMESLRVAGLQAMFEDNAGIELVVEPATTEEELGNGWLDPTVRVALIGSLPGGALPRLIASMRRARPDLHIIVMSPVSGDKAVLSVLGLGGKGFLHDSASPSEVEQAIHAVASGCIWASRRLQADLIQRLLAARDPAALAPGRSFTAREQQVLDLLLEGKSNREIATRLDIEERTVKSYVAKLMAKVGVKNRTALSMRTVSTNPIP